MITPFNFRENPPPREIFISQIDECLQTVSDIREKIISRRAGILSGKDNSFAELFAFESKDLLHQIESFNIQAKLSDSEEYFIEDIYPETSSKTDLLKIL